VATVVARLFLQVQPDFAFLGRKDLQQVAVIRRMARDLDFPISIEVGETVREPDGLALSSRNAYLSPDERQLAAGFPAALFEARDRVAAGERDVEPLEQDTRRDLEAAGLAVGYVEVVSPDTMSRPARIEPGSVLCAAVRAGKTRLIDNVLLLDE
jgi:pantoate--beta-alanine ligase